MLIPEAVAILGTVRYQFFIDVDVTRFTTQGELVTAYNNWELRTL